MQMGPRTGGFGGGGQKPMPDFSFQEGASEKTTMEEIPIIEEKPSVPENEEEIDVKDIPF